MGTEPTPLSFGRPDVPRPDALSGAAPRSSADGARKTANAAPFEALLEGLAGRAQELGRAAQELNGPEELIGAVETARASLEDALSLREQLLAAFHEARQRDPDGPTQS